MELLIKVCDRCKKVITDKDDFKIVIYKNYNHDHFNLCRECMFKLKDWMCDNQEVIKWQLKSLEKS